MRQTAALSSLTSMRIVSLVPHATELLYALGLGDQIVGVTHECDHPAAALQTAKVTSSRIDSELTSAAIEAAVLQLTRADEPLYRLDEIRLAELQPDLIITQSLCHICAVSEQQVRALAEQLPTAPRVIALAPTTLGEAMGDIRTVAHATDSQTAALDLVARGRARIDAVRRSVAKLKRRTVLAIEWLDPLYVAGHWTPQLIDYAGGIDVLGFAGEPSERIDWEQARAVKPEVLLLIPCGYDAAQALGQARAYAEQIAAIGAEETIVLDACAYFSRPGPRLVDGLETLAHALHPAAVPQAPGAVLRLNA